MLNAICSKKELTLCSYYLCVNDIIDSRELRELEYIAHHVSSTRFQHCLNVSYYSYIICRKFGLNARSAARAGLLHDLFYYDRKTYNSTKTKKQPSHSDLHSFIALQNAEKLTELSQLERDIIAKHMWPVTKKLPSYKESYVVTVIDKYCAVLEYCIPKLKKALDTVKG